MTVVEASEASVKFSSVVSIPGGRSGCGARAMRTPAIFIAELDCALPVDPDTNVQHLEDRGRRLAGLPGCFSVQNATTRKT